MTTPRAVLRTKPKPHRPPCPMYTSQVACSHIAVDRLAYPLAPCNSHPAFGFLRWNPLNFQTREIKRCPVFDCTKQSECVVKRTIPPGKRAPPHPPYLQEAKEISFHAFMISKFAEPLYIKKSKYLDSIKKIFQILRSLSENGFFKGRSISCTLLGVAWFFFIHPSRRTPHGTNG